jgi:hypothetical protein
LWWTRLLRRALLLRPSLLLLWSRRTWTRLLRLRLLLLLVFRSRLSAPLAATTAASAS